MNVLFPRLARSASLGPRQLSCRVAALLLTASAAMFAVASPAAWAADSPALPNIILIMADDLGFSDFGCYGSEIGTENIDRLAAGGLRFTQFYNAARCCPTRASLLTGLYPHQAGIGHMVQDRGLPAYRGDLSRRCPTIAEVLRPAGYRSYLAGKWHVTPLGDSKDNWPLQRGFDGFFGLIYSVRSYFDPPTLTRDNEPASVASSDFYLTDAISDAAVAYLDDAAKADQPFFLYVAYTAPHWPLHAREEDIAKYRQRYTQGWDALRAERHRRLVDLQLIDSRWPLSPRDAPAPAWQAAADKRWQAERMAVYAAMIDRMDQGIGLIMAKLRDIGREDNTLVMVLSDNGGCAEDLLPADAHRFPAKSRQGRKTHVGNDPAIMPGPEHTFQSYGLPWANASNTPFRRYKHWVHEGGIASPLVVSWPGVIRPGITHEVGHVIDLLPTFLEAAGAALPEQHAGQATLPLEGRSLLPVLRGRPGEARAPLFWEHEGNRAVRHGKWKLVALHNQEWELYDMEVDRTEMQNLAARQPDKVAELAGLYDRWAERVGVVAWDDLPAVKEPVK